MSTSSTGSSYLVTPLTFTGQSKYSATFQNIIDKAVQTQSIPLAQIQDQLSSDQGRQTALNSLDSSLQSLQTAVNNLSSAVGQNSLQSNVSDTSTASVSLGTNASSGTYQLEIDNLGSAAQTLSEAGSTVSDPSNQSISSSSSFTLTVNGAATTITPAANTLNALVTAINQNSSLGVTASLVNVGSSGSPDYRLSLQSNALGPNTIQLNDGQQDLLTALNGGSLATYKLDNLPQTITSDSDSITLAPGVTVNLLQTTPASTPTTITVAQSTTQAQTALQQFATAYNSVVSNLATQHGQNAGALSGESVLMIASEALQQIGGYSTSGGSLQYLDAVGLNLNQDGTLTFDADTFQKSVGSNFSALSQFLGTSTTGFVGSATQAINMLEDSTTGTVKTEEASITKDITNLGVKALDTTNQINLFQQNLVNQLSASDAAIVVLQSQLTFFQGYFNTNSSSS